NSDLVPDETDRSRLRTIAEHRGGNNAAADDCGNGLSPEAQALLDIFSASTPEDFRARLNAGPANLQRRLDALSPSEVVRQIQAPLILIHGINDPVIPAQQTIEFAEAARANGLNYSLTLLRMYGHVNPILPRIGLRSLLSFYLPETFRFLRVVNQLISMM